MDEIRIISVMPFFFFLNIDDFNKILTRIVQRLNFLKVNLEFDP